MKFSILLPTRNRADLLRLAVKSVQMQDYADWEIVVSDNMSDQDIAGDVRSLGDARISALRQASLVPVTDNWNAALAASSGDYFIMLGDDDALAPGALSAIAALVERWRRPAAIYAQALQYAYPGVVPDHPDAFVQFGYNEFLQGRREAFALPKSAALRAVRAAMAFRLLYMYNMQHFVISRELVERLKPKGPFFQSPYPDYYAANAVLLEAEPLVATPEIFTLIGISPKSFGYYYMNERERDGTEFLRNVAEPDIARRVRDKLMPGSNLNDSWLCAMETLARNFPERVGNAVKHRGYRRLQYHALIRSRRRREALRQMRWWELPLYAAAAAALLALRALPSRPRDFLRSHLVHLVFDASPRFDAQRRTVPYRDILEAALGEVPAPRAAERGL
ncbi:MAG: glycosyltransferase family 2 protein [Burkholderiales bacterium]